MRCFFHVSYGQMTWDEEGTELQDLAEVRNAAVKLSAALLSDLDGDGLWSGVPWHLWVTQGPKGTGKTLFALSFSAKSPP
jgi:hypothetical protein